jgi:hypothetical protein
MSKNVPFFGHVGSKFEEKLKLPQNQNFLQNFYGKDAEFSANSKFVEMGSQKCYRKKL